MAAAPLEKLEAAVRRLAADVGEQRKTLEEHGAILEQQGEILERHTQALDDIASSVKQIAKTQGALTNAMTAAMKQLGMDRSLKLRVKRLEDAVFGAKH